MNFKTQTTARGGRKAEGHKINRIWNHIRERQKVWWKKCGFLLFGEDERLRRRRQSSLCVINSDQCPAVRHINRSVCLNSTHHIPSGYLWLKIEVRCHHSVCVCVWGEVCASVCVCVSLGFSLEEDGQQMCSPGRYILRKHAQKPHKTWQTLTNITSSSCPEGGEAGGGGNSWPC